MPQRMRGLETGTPVYVLENGKIVDLTKRYRRKAKLRRDHKVK
jgi:hypothetical protein